ncbi:lysine--tRNA ligase [Patescibacteria group bacterium]|nr:lysine--tRNA ligase [Patescibacteria group bacterium]MCL5010141.1 lysine--tRNA ligase [Patescibacteria group bacterium]
MEEYNLKEIRLEKLKKLRELGINPYPPSFDKKQTIADCLKSSGKTVKTAGRIFSYREHGNIAFADLKDDSGKIQIFFQKKLLGETFKNLKLLDIGDYIGVEGEVVKTTAGEISISPISFTLLTKSLLPLPSEWFGLKDIETRLRKRYLDLLFNPDLKDIFRKKAVFWQSIRKYLVEKGFLEVENPALEPIPGGADARPFITHHNALDIDLYLRISLELYQKRLLVGGYEKVFEIGKVFRNEGVDSEHLQDYTQMEFYWAYANYEDLMIMLEDMYKKVTKETFGTLKIKSQGQEIDWGRKWEKVDYFEAFKKATGIDLNDVSKEELLKKARELRLSPEENLGKGRLIDLIYKKRVRPFIIQPTFLINHPVEVSPLAKRDPKNPNKVQRLQILAYGSELGNGFSELNDPIDQRKRFEEQARLRKAGDEEAQMMDTDFVEALEYGMPPAAGFGLSERLFAFLVDMPMREAVFFPPLRSK